MIGAGAFAPASVDAARASGKFSPVAMIAVDGAAKVWSPAIAAAVPYRVAPASRVDVTLDVAPAEGARATPKTASAPANRPTATRFGVPVRGLLKPTSWVVLVEF